MNLYINSNLFVLLLQLQQPPSRRRGGNQRKRKDRRPDSYLSNYDDTDCILDILIFGRFLLFTPFLHFVSHCAQLFLCWIWVKGLKSKGRKWLQATFPSTSPSLFFPSPSGFLVWVFFFPALVEANWKEMVTPGSQSLSSPRCKVLAVLSVGERNALAALFHPTNLPI